MIKNIIFLIFSLPSFKALAQNNPGYKSLDFEKGMKDYGIKRLEPISQSEVEKAFGVSISGTRATIGTVSPAPMKINALDYLGITQIQKNNLLSGSSCQGREYEIISVNYKNDLHGLSIFYNCEGSCSAILEQHRYDPMTETKRWIGRTDFMPQNSKLCEALWSGKVKFRSIK